MPILTVQDDSFPHLCFGDAACPLPWHRGQLHTLRTATNFMRVTPRGLQFSSVDTLLAPSASTWHSFACNLTAKSGALCEEPRSGMLLFPTGDVIVPDTRAEDDTAFANSYLAAVTARNIQGVRGSPCTRSHTGRSQTVDDDTYDFSLCDLLDNNADLIIAPAGTGTLRVYWRADTTDTALLVLLGLLSIYLVSCIAQNIVATLQDPAAPVPASQRIATVLTLALLLWSFALRGAISNVVVAADVVLFAHLFLYCVLELAYQLWVDADRARAPRGSFAASISVLAAALLLITLRLHYTFDNPYLAVLATIFGVRTMYKLFVFESTHLLHHAMHAADVFVLCSLLGNGVLRADVDHFEGTLSAVLVAVVALFAGGLLAAYRAAQDVLGVSAGH